jgi:AcrR family transcriptional regulator
MAKFSKTDWLDLGLKILANDGGQAIRVDNLCETAGRTKGSFYHHFINRDAFVADLVNYWEQRLTDYVITKTNQQSSASARIIILNRIASDLDAELERAIRRWAGSEALVEPGVVRVDKRRVEYLASLWYQAKNITSQQAIDLAIMNYASLVGFQQIYIPVAEDRRRRIDKLQAKIAANLPDRH